MNALINRMQSYENPNTSFCIEESNFNDYSKINFVKNESLIGKSARFDHSKQALLIAAILLSQPNKFLAAPMIVSEHCQIDFRQAQIPSFPASPRFDSRLFYMPNQLEAKSENKAKLEAEFNSLVKQWKEETFFISSSSKMFNHPAYIRIMAMGTAGLPLVLKELQNNSGRWFYALKFMAGESGKDVAEGMNNYEDAKAAWLEWGYNNNLI